MPQASMRERRTIPTYSRLEQCDLSNNSFNVKFRTEPTATVIPYTPEVRCARMGDHPEAIRVLRLTSPAHRLSFRALLDEMCTCCSTSTRTLG